MGNFISRQKTAQPFLDAAASLSRRERIWANFQTIVQRIKDVVGVGQKPTLGSPIVPSSTVQHETGSPVTPQQPGTPHYQDEPSSGRSDTSGADQTESQEPPVVDQQPKDQNTTDKKGSAVVSASDNVEASGDSSAQKNQEPEEQEPQSHARDTTKDDIAVGNIIKAIEAGAPRPTINAVSSYPKTYESRLEKLDAVYSHVAPGLRRPSKPRTNKGIPINDDGKQVVGNEKNSTGATVNGYDDQVVEYVFSALAVALPEPQYSRPDTKLVFRVPIDIGSQNRIVDANPNAELAGSPANNAAPDRDGGSSESREQETGVNYLKWDPNFYSTLGLDRHSIRLVQILPGSLGDDISLRINVDSLQRVAMKYEALSYVWGDPKNPKEIFVNNVKVPINSNLYDALISLRQPDSERCIWIDAICLNQMSRAEQSREIPKMGQIYNLAKTVNVFLGAPSPSKPTSIDTFFAFLNRDDGGDAAIQYAQDGLNGFDRVCEKLQLNVPDVCKGFMEACLQPWWGRIWTLQEFYLAEEEPIWYWGRAHASNGSLKRDFDLLVNFLGDLSRTETADGRVLSDLKMAMTKGIGPFKFDLERISALISRRYRTHGFDTPRRLYRELTNQATKPHDFVYGLRDIFDPIFGKVFMPDYRMPVELLFTCLAIFLIQFECWGDVLWWYPSRYTGGIGRYPSWLPNFTIHIVPHEFDVQPMDQSAKEKPRPLAVLNHRLHAEGYNLDTVYGHRHLDKSDPQKIYQELWQFDHGLNNNHECHEHFIKGAAPEVLLGMYESFYSKWTHFNSAFRGALLQSTMKPEDHDKLPRQVAECMPSWDVLRWHALGIATPGLLEALGHDNRDHRPGCLENIFSARMREVFRNAFADFFIGACILDWNHLSVWLNRFPDATQWCRTNDRYWSEIQESLPKGTEKRSQLIAESYKGYTADIQPEVMRVSWCSSFYYTFLAYVILLDCDNHASLANIISKLQNAGNGIRRIYFSTPATKIYELAPKVPSVATRLSYYETVMELFRGRYLLWTDGGFRGISSPGVETCCDKKSIVAIVDGLSFPVIVRDYDEETGEGWLAGCALIRGVNMLSRDTETATLPPDYKRGEKRIFKFQ